MAGFASPTRGVVAGGEGASPYPTRDIIEFVTIASTGNMVDFGNLGSAQWAVSGCSSPTRGIINGNFPSGGTIQFITIASTGNAQDFGDWNDSNNSGASFSSSTRGVWAHGNDGGTSTVEYVEFATLGNGVNFGNSRTEVYRSAACSNGHGGL